MILLRTGMPPSVSRHTDRSWRTWAYDEAHNLPALGKVAISFTPLARDKRSVFGPLTYFDTVGHVIDGLIAAGTFADKRDIIDLILRRSRIIGVDGLEVVVLT
jgi:hypothetical protein